MFGARLASVYGQVEAASGNDEQAVKWHEKTFRQIDLIFEQDTNTL